MWRDESQCDREQERKKHKEQHDRMNSDLHVNNE